MSKFTTPPKAAFGSLRLVLFMAAALLLTACNSDDDNNKSQGYVGDDAARAALDLKHQKVDGEFKIDWASIQNLDPRGEECRSCHEGESLSPNGGKGHNVGLKKNTDHSAYADLKITGVKVNEKNGEVTVTLNKNLPANAGNLSMTFAKLAPRVIHNRGHDWQNYFVSNALGRGGNEPASSMLPNGGAAPQTVPNPQVNGKTITFNLGGGEGRSWGEHAFTVGTAYEPEKDTLSWVYGDKNDANVAGRVLGTKFTAANWKISEHSYCNEAATDSNQLANADGDKPLCWWPDSTHLTSGVFITKADEYIVAYEPDYTHRVTIILGSTPGNPGFNTWYDFVPSVANGTKTVVKDADKTGAATELVVPDNAPDYIAANGAVIAGGDDGYGAVSAGRNVAPFGADTHSHQKLPAAREVVDVQSCNSCHDGLTMHGGSGRSQTQVCVTCHNPGNLQASSARSADFKVLIHRIHRGANLPSEEATIAGLMEGKGTLLAQGVNDKGEAITTATDFTKVRFPQGPTPGSAAGITNCVKCHMGEDSRKMVQKVATDLGAGDENTYNVQKELKLAKVTPQGDNWLSVRSVNACQACHDSNIFFTAGGRNDASSPGNSIDVGSRHSTSPTAINGADKTLPFYTDKYSGIGFAWMGKKLDKNQNAGWLHTRRSLVGTSGNNDGFTCGGGGGCHDNDAVGESLASNVGIRGSNNNIHGVHLELTRNFIIAERFEIQVKDVKVDATGFSAEVKVFDKKENAFVNVETIGNTLDELDAIAAANAANAGTTEVTLALNAMFGWMANGSPDYNHSAGGGFGSNWTALTSAGQPGAPAGLKSVTFTADTGSISISWDDIKAVSGIEHDFTKDFDKATSFGTVAVNANLAIKNTDTRDASTSGYRGVVTTNYRLRSANQDFSFADGMLADGELARRQVVDFSAGSGNDANRDRYAGWDKEHGSNTQSCSSCHLKLDMHGATASNNTQMCVMCHNPNVTDLRARAGNNAGVSNLDADGKIKLGDDGQYEESEDFKRLIHGVHAAANFRIDPLQTRFAQRPSADATARGQSFPGVLSNCKSCHIQDEDSGQWTFELDQLPEGMIGSTVITGDWKTVAFDPKGTQHDLDSHMKMSPIASVCSSCHDAGYKTTGGRMNNNILDGGPYVGSHWWVMGGIAPGIVPDNGTKPSDTKHQSGKWTDFSKAGSTE